MSTLDENACLYPKIRDLLEAIIELEPSPEDFANPSFDEYFEHEVSKLYQRAEFLFLLHGKIDIASRVAKTLKTWVKHGLSWRIQDGPHEDDVASLVELKELLRAVQHALGEKDHAYSPGYEALCRVFSNFHLFYTENPLYPINEDIFHKQCESVLRPFFHNLVHKPQLKKVGLKGFIPDTGIPETKSLIDYKFATDKATMKRVVDEIYADYVGFSSNDYDNNIFVIYQTRHITSPKELAPTFKNLKRTRFFLVTGSTNS